MGRGSVKDKIATFGNAADCYIESKDYVGDIAINIHTAFDKTISEIEKFLNVSPGVYDQQKLIKYFANNLEALSLMADVYRRCKSCKIPSTCNQCSPVILISKCLPGKGLEDPEIEAKILAYKPVKPTITGEPAFSLLYALHIRSIKTEKPKLMKVGELIEE